LPRSSISALRVFSSQFQVSSSAADPRAFPAISALPPHGLQLSSDAAPAAGFILRRRGYPGAGAAAAFVPVLLGLTMAFGGP
jgi:hypothetical protein